MICTVKAERSNSMTFFFFFFNSLTFKVFLFTTHDKHATNHVIMRTCQNNNQMLLSLTLCCLLSVWLGPELWSSTPSRLAEREQSSFFAVGLELVSDKPNKWKIKAIKGLLSVQHHFGILVLSAGSHFFNLLWSRRTVYLLLLLRR